MNSVTNISDSIVYEPSDDNEQVALAIPDYLKEVYHWAYLDAGNARWLDREWVVAIILWGNAKRLRQAVLAQVEAGDHVLQVANVYGRLIPELAKKVGVTGALEVIDIAPLQVSRCQTKLEGFENSSVRIADASVLTEASYDLVDCFFLLHEVPDEFKIKIVHAVLSQVALGGKAIFVDYHQPHSRHPLRQFMQFIFRHYEPFAEGLLHQNIKDMATEVGSFTWQTRTLFGGLYQITIATRSI